MNQKKPQQTVNVGIAKERKKKNHQAAARSLRQQNIWRTCSSVFAREITHWNPTPYRSHQAEKLQRNLQTNPLSITKLQAEVKQHMELRIVAGPRQWFVMSLWCQVCPWTQVTPAFHWPHYLGLEYTDRRKSKLKYWRDQTRQSMLQISHFVVFFFLT